MSQWNPSAKKYMAPKINDKGGKSINVISTQTNRSIHINLPLLMTWGISDFTDEKGESDGKFSISLNFPNNEYATPETNLALQKLKEFEEELLKDAVTNSEAWFGKKQSREIVEYGFFPFMKYPKNKETKATDYTRPPSIRPKVPKYDQDWKIEIYDTKRSLLFPSEKGVSPIDLIPKQSNVACMISCGGIWIGGKGWGLTWKLVQCVVKPQIMESVFGKCHIQLTDTDIEGIENSATKQEPVTSSYTEDSDTEYEPVKKPVSAPVVKEVEAPVPEVVSVPEPVVQNEPEVKESPVENVSEPAVAAEPVVATKKKIVKKVVTKAAV
jgi:hypothetical protein